MSPDFEPDNFLGLTSEEKISKCYAMAAEAERFAAKNTDQQREYLSLAARWYELAEEMRATEPRSIPSDARRS